MILKLLQPQWHFPIKLGKFLTKQTGILFTSLDECVMKTWFGLAYGYRLHCIVHMDGVEFDQTSKQTKYIFLVGLGWGDYG